MPPYLPFLEALGEHVDGRCRALREQAGPLAPVLATILPELACALGELPSSLPAAARAGRACASSRRSTSFLAAIAGADALLLLLDDLQWADPASLDLLCYVARRHRRARGC